ncbi:hypothetical protein [Enterobacillus tribolii]|uniref:DUF1883 domain-containing protein n=1 Tax=Enterobacillus tribolii TaxID=1487935 RepID=A0A370R209_9GAMM|nr:hypothetical protein [Enterobacillus tribolii]MBW7982971.1 hypothetical protein [Enterobacillus tribolii]RDK95925.1 hypothetical protein C8D90_102409 [Enterobacillus tribolii]
MSIVRTCLNLFAGDTVIVRCTHDFHLHLTGERATQSAVITARGNGEAYLSVPYSGLWNVVLDTKSDAPEHSISYQPA